MMTGSVGSGWQRVTALMAPALVIAGCAGAPDTSESQSQERAPAIEAEEPLIAPKMLPDTSWRVIDILGKSASAAQSTINFGANEVNGSTGCNDFRGSVEVEGEHLKFGPLATTRKMCTPPVNGQETVFLEALSVTHSWQRTGDKLELLDEGGAILVYLEPL